MSSLPLTQVTRCSAIRLPVVCRVEVGDHDPARSGERGGQRGRARTFHRMASRPVRRRRATGRSRSRRPWRGRRSNVVGAAPASVLGGAGGREHDERVVATTDRIDRVAAAPSGGSVVESHGPGARPLDQIGHLGVAVAGVDRHAHVAHRPHMPRAAEGSRRRSASAAPAGRPARPPDAKPGRDTAALLGQLGGGRLVTVVESNRADDSANSSTTLLHVGQCRTS